MMKYNSILQLFDASCFLNHHYEYVILNIVPSYEQCDYYTLGKLALWLQNSLN